MTSPVGNLCEDGEVHNPFRTAPTLKQRWYVLRRSVVAFWMGREIDNGAKLTFFTFLAFAPTLLALYSLATLFLANNQGLVADVTDRVVDDFVPEGYEAVAKDVVATVVGSAAGGIVGLIISIAISLFSASAYVRAFARTANDIYAVREGRPLYRLWLSMFLVTIVLVLGMLIVLAALGLNFPLVEALLVPIAEPLGLQNIVLALTETFLPIWQWLKWPVVAATLMLMLDVLYHFTPNTAPPKFRWLSSGSIIALFGITVVGALFFFYLRFLTSLSSYGAIGTVLALMFAVWGINIMVVFGLIVDVETERIYQLRDGRKSERDMDVELRDSKAIEFQDRVYSRLVDEGSQVRRAQGD